MLAYTLAAFEKCDPIDGIVIVGPVDRLDTCEALSRQMGCRKVKDVVVGGVERQDSVQCGMDALPANVDFVAVHDGARPLVDPEDITRVIAAANETGAAVLGTPTSDTVKRVIDGRVQETLDRSTLWSVQTPQVFRVALLREAQARASHDGFVGTDDTVLVERIGQPVTVVSGSRENIKVTVPEDLDRVRSILTRAEDTHPPRIGMGYDVHALVEGRPLILGGVDIPFERGLQGHSDADVLIHVVIDAVLGAVGAGDIGRLFPDTDAAYKDISSLVLLERTANVLRECGATIVNIDATVVAQQPKLAPYIPEMESNIARSLGVAEALISVKATTTERLGFVGREEGIAAQAVAMVGH
jgi:2-C-methyl-D-erythritol 2,4-cyclodiphosphate synthase/2-C-methyl-D-erythritol 4-phosphate cytidylyltransferase